VSVFVDTSALYALLDRDDAEHRRAADVFPRLLDEERLVTHNYVAVELMALVQRRLQPPAMSACVQQVLPALDMVWVTHDVHAAAEHALLGAGRPRPSLVDWVSFEVMRRRDIDMAFAFDADFAAQGFRTVP
jgi:predicted nucleic acid-binding protein